MDEALRIADVPQHAGDVAEHDELLGADRRGHRRSGRVGVDVELLAVGRDRHRRDHRHLPGVGEVVDREPVDPRDLAHVAEIERLAIRAFERELLPEEDVGREEVERHGAAAVFLDLRREVVVEFGGKHLLDDVERGLIGVATALYESRLDAHLIHRTADRLAAAMNDHHAHAERRHEDDVEQEMAERIGVLDDAAAQLDDGGGVAKLADPPQGFDQRVGLLDGLLLHFGNDGAAGHGRTDPW